VLRPIGVQAAFKDELQEAFVLLAEDLHAIGG
jgi:hypothetical protein